MSEKPMSFEMAVINKLSALRDEQRQLGERLIRLGAEKGRVSAVVHERVRTDYERQLAVLTERAQPLEEEARQQEAEAKVSFEKAQAAFDAARLDREEVELRWRLGEFPESELKERAGKLDAVVAQREKELTAIGDFRTKLAAVAEPPVLAAATASAQAEAEPEPEPAAVAEIVEPPPVPAAPPPPPVAVTPPSPVTKPWPADIAHGPTIATAPHVIPEAPPPPAPPPPPPPPVEVAKVAPPPPPPPPKPVDLGATVIESSMHAPGPDPSEAPTGKPQAAPVPSPSSASKARRPAPPIGATVMFDAEPGEPTVIPRKALLIASEPIGGRTEMPLEVVTTIGRTPQNQIALGQGSVSRRHAEITLTDKGYLLRDQGSENGTFVNGERITDRLLVDGDRLLFGSVALVFRQT